MKSINKISQVVRPLAGSESGPRDRSLIQRRRVSLVWTRHWSAIWLAGVLLLVSAVVLRGVSIGEFSLNTDEAHHAFTGLFFADFLRDLPVSHAMQYVYLYYARYPVLGLIHWPPFFHLVEGVMFLVLGPSVITARLTVLIFAVVGSYFWFRLVAELEDVWVAAASTVLLALLPSLLLYEKAVMLEVPSLALCITASYFWIRHLRQGGSRHLYCFALFAGMALLTKQHAIYLAPFCLLTAIVNGKWLQLLCRKTLWAVAICLLMAGPFYVVTFKVHSQTVAAAVLEGAGSIKHPLLYYWSILPQQLGWVVLALSVMGVVILTFWEKTENALLMLMWIVACYITFTPFALKEPRYILSWLPPFVYFAVAPLTSRSLRPRMRLVTTGLVLILLGNKVWAGWHYQRPYLSGYAAAARRLVQEEKSGIILYDGELSANFCFYVRTNDPARRYVVLRKALYATNNAKVFGAVQLVRTRQEIENLLRVYGIRHIFVEQSTSLDFEIQKTLREFLQTPQFRLIEAFRIESNMPKWQGRNLLFYENTRAVPRTAKVLRLTMLTLSHDVVVPLDELLGTPD